MLNELLIYLLLGTLRKTLKNNIFVLNVLLSAHTVCLINC